MSLAALQRRNADFRREIEREQFTKEKVLPEAETALEYVAEYLDRVLFGVDLVEALSQLAVPKSLASLAPVGNAKLRCDIRKHKRLRLAISTFFEYAIHGRISPSDELESLYETLKLLLTLEDKLAAEYHDHFTAEREDIRSPGRLRFVRDLAAARGRIDYGRLPRNAPQEGFFGNVIVDFKGDVTGEDLILLSGLSEGTVRNATAAQGSARLTTRRRGKVAFIEQEEAERWLGVKVGYRPTSIVDEVPWFKHAHQEIGASDRRVIA